MEHNAELLSLFLTLPTIIMACVVIYLWGPKTAFILKGKRPIKDCDWFIIGVTVGFIGQFADNLYWAIPWSLSYIGSEYTDLFMFNGVWFNIPSRQICGIIAAYCHIKSYLMYCSSSDTNEARNITILNTGSFVLGGVYIAILMYLRHI